MTGLRRIEGAISREIDRIRAVQSGRFSRSTLAGMMFSAMSGNEFDLAELLLHPKLTLRHLVAPTIFRLASTRKQRLTGTREVSVGFRRKVSGRATDTPITFSWALRDLDPPSRYNEFREELRKLDATLNANQITELAALGVAFGSASLLLPDDAITRVVSLGGRGDFYLNGRRDEMIEIAGIKTGSVTALFGRKKKQILENQKLVRAFVCVVSFETAAMRFERVR